MLSPKAFGWLCLLALFGLFGFAATRVIMLRVDHGDIYPKYSSFRADPMGSKAFYESLIGVDGIRSSRNLKRLSDLKNEVGTTVFVLGISPRSLDKEHETYAEQLDEFLNRGNRVVLALDGMVRIPQTQFFKQVEAQERAEEEERESQSSEPEQAEEQQEEAEALEDIDGLIPPAPPLPDEESVLPQPPDSPEPESAEETPAEQGFKLPAGSDLILGFDFARAEAEDPEAITVQSREATESAINWPGFYYFSNFGEAWTAVYSGVGQPVVLERRVGAGTLVISSDAFHFSNEALWRDPQAQLLSWFCGPNQKILFEESHFGMNFKPSIGMLIWRYRLHGVMAGLLLLAALFLWKNAQPLVPPGERSWHAETLGKDAAAGLNHLLRRSVPKSKLLRTCWEQWRAVGSLGGRAQPKVTGDAESLLAQQDQLQARDRELISGYAKLREIISKRR